MKIVLIFIGALTLCVDVVHAKSYWHYECDKSYGRELYITQFIKEMKDGCKKERKINVNIAKTRIFAEKEIEKSFGYKYCGALLDNCLMYWREKSNMANKTQEIAMVTPIAIHTQKSYIKKKIYQNTHLTYM